MDEKHTILPEAVGSMLSSNPIICSRTLPGLAMSQALSQAGFLTVITALHYPTYCFCIVDGWVVLTKRSTQLSVINTLPGVTIMCPWQDLNPQHFMIGQGPLYKIRIPRFIHHWPKIWQYHKFSFRGWLRLSKKRWFLKGTGNEVLLMPRRSLEMRTGARGVSRQQLHL